MWWYRDTSSFRAPPEFYPFRETAIPPLEVDRITGEARGLIPTPTETISGSVRWDVSLGGRGEVQVGRDDKWGQYIIYVQYIRL